MNNQTRRPEHQRKWSATLVLLIISLILVGASPTIAGTTNVSVGDDYFSPPSLAIGAGDTVTWKWKGRLDHSSTSTNGLWDSGVLRYGAAFSFTFNIPGLYPYKCTVHPSIQTGSVQVAPASNSPPAITIAMPAQNAVYASPFQLVVSGSTPDPRWPIEALELYIADTLLGNLPYPGPDFRFEGPVLTAGTYSLAIVADYSGGVKSSQSISFSIVDPQPIHLSSPRLENGVLTFKFTGTAGLGYVVQKATPSAKWFPIQTNLPLTGTATIWDHDATNQMGLYRVLLMPNPL